MEVSKQPLVALTPGVTLKLIVIIENDNRNGDDAQDRLCMYTNNYVWIHHQKNIFYFFTITAKNLIPSSNALVFMDQNLPPSSHRTLSPSLALTKVIGSSVHSDNAGASFSATRLAITAGAGSIVISIDEKSLSHTSDQFFCSIPSYSAPKIKPASCVALSPCRNLLATGEIGHSPAILVFSTAPNAPNTPLLSLHEHRFGVTHLAWSTCGSYLASLGTSNDGFLHIWHIKQKENGSFFADLIASNKCLSTVFDMKWVPFSPDSSTPLGHILITAGIRHLRIWRLFSSSSSGSPSSSTSNLNSDFKEVLANRNVVLGPHSSSTFVSIQPINHRIVAVVSEKGEIGRISLNYNQPLSSCHTPLDQHSTTTHQEVSDSTDNDDTETVNSLNSQSVPNGNPSLERTICGSVTGTFDVVSSINFKPSAMKCASFRHTQTHGLSCSSGDPNEENVGDLDQDSKVLWITGTLSELCTIPLSIFSEKQPSTPSLIYPTYYFKNKNEEAADNLGKDKKTGQVIAMSVPKKDYIIRFTNSNELVVTKFTKKTDKTANKTTWHTEENVIRLGNEEGIKGFKRVADGCRSSMSSLQQNNGEFVTWSAGGLIRLWSTKENRKSSSIPKGLQDTMCIDNFKIEMNDWIDITTTAESTRLDLPNCLTTVSCVDYSSPNNLDTAAKGDAKKLFVFGDKHGVIRFLEYPKIYKPPLELTDTNTSQEITQFFKAHSSEVVGIEYNKHINLKGTQCDFEVLFTYGRDKIIQVFYKQTILEKTNDAEDWVLLQTLDNHKSAINRVLVQENCNRIVACSNDRTISIHKAIYEDASIETGPSNLLVRFKKLIGYVPEKTISLKATPCDMFIVGENESTTAPLSLLNKPSSNTLAGLARFSSHKRSSDSKVGFLAKASATQTELVVSCNDKQVYIFKFPTGELVRQFKSVDQRGDSIILKRINVVKLSLPIIYDSPQVSSVLSTLPMTAFPPSYYLVAMAADKSIRLYDFSNRTSLQLLSTEWGHAESITDLDIIDYSYSIPPTPALSSPKRSQKFYGALGSPIPSPKPQLPEISINLVSCANDGCVFLWSVNGLEVFHINYYTPLSISSLLLPNEMSHMPPIGFEHGMNIKRRASSNPNRSSTIQGNNSLMDSSFLKSDYELNGAKNVMSLRTGNRAGSYSSNHSPTSLHNVQTPVRRVFSKTEITRLIQRDGEVERSNDERANQRETKRLSHSSSHSSLSRKSSTTSPTKPADIPAKLVSPNNSICGTSQSPSSLFSIRNGAKPGALRKSFRDDSPVSTNNLSDSLQTTDSNNNSSPPETNHSLTGMNGSSLCVGSQPQNLQKLQEDSKPLAASNFSSSQALVDSSLPNNIEKPGDHVCLDPKFIMGSYANEVTKRATKPKPCGLNKVTSKVEEFENASVGGTFTKKCLVAPPIHTASKLNSENPTLKENPRQTVHSDKEAAISPDVDKGDRFSKMVLKKASHDEKSPPLLSPNSPKVSQLQKKLSNAFISPNNRRSKIPGLPTNSSPTPVRKGHTKSESLYDLGQQKPATNVDALSLSLLPTPDFSPVTPTQTPPLRRKASGTHRRTLSAFPSSHSTTSSPFSASDNYSKYLIERASQSPTRIPNLVSTSPQNPNPYVEKLCEDLRQFRIQLALSDPSVQNEFVTEKHGIQMLVTELSKTLQALNKPTLLNSVGNEPSVSLKTVSRSSSFSNSSRRNSVKSTHQAEYKAFGFQKLTSSPLTDDSKWSQKNNLTQRRASNEENCLESGADSQSYLQSKDASLGIDSNVAKINQEPFDSKMNLSQGDLNVLTKPSALLPWSTTVEDKSELVHGTQMDMIIEQIGDRLIGLVTEKLESELHRKLNLDK